MIVNDILPNVTEVIGKSSTTYLFDLITDAVQLLANKSTWDPLIGYVDIAVPSIVPGGSPETITYGTPAQRVPDAGALAVLVSGGGDLTTKAGIYLTLPPQVEAPIKINVNNNPAFSRNQLYEFTMNTPGTQDIELGWAWADRGPTPLNGSQQAWAPSVVKVLSSQVGETIPIVLGVVDAVTGVESQISLAPGSISTIALQDITFVYKPATVGDYTLVVPPYGTNNVIGTYLAAQTIFGTQRRIKLSQPATSVRMLFRRKVFKISSATDYIPLHNKMAIVLMVKAVYLNRKDHYDAAAAAEAKALQYLKEEQDALKTFESVAASMEKDSAINANIGVRETIVVSDIYDDAAAIFGPIGQQKIFDKITMACEVLANESVWDSTLGYVDLHTNDLIGPDSFFTLPRYVESPVKINVNGHPNLMRNKWYEFHLSGWGGGDDRHHRHHFLSHSGWEDKGDTYVVNSLPHLVGAQIVAIPDNPSDDFTEIRVFGLDATGKEIYQNGQEGFLVPCVSGFTTPAVGVPNVVTVFRISKAKSLGYIQLVALNADGSTGVLLGYYYPDELEPRYRRICVHHKTKFIRMRYRKRSAKVSSMTEILNLRSRLAITTMLRSIKANEGGDIAGAVKAQTLAIQYIEQEQHVNDSGDAPGIDIYSSVYMGGDTISCI